MDTVTIWHNPRCSKSRQTLALLEARGVAPVVRRYLDDPPTRAELEDVLRKLGMAPEALLRRGEPEYAELGPGSDVIDAMIEHPRLIERPIVIKGDRAAIGRPPEAALEVL